MGVTTTHPTRAARASPSLVTLESSSSAVTLSARLMILDRFQLIIALAAAIDSIMNVVVRYDMNASINNTAALRPHLRKSNLVLNVLQKLPRLNLAMKPQSCRVKQQITIFENN